MRGPRDTPLDWILLIGGIVLSFGGAILARQLTGSGLFGVSVLLLLSSITMWSILQRTLARRLKRDPTAVAREAKSLARVFIPIFAVAILAVGLAAYMDLRQPRVSQLPELIVPRDFPGAVQALQSLTERSITPLEGDESLYVVTVSSRWANRYLRAARDKFADQQFFLARFDLYFHDDTVPVRVLLAPVRDGYEVLRMVGTSGTQGPETAEIDQQLRRLNRDYPFDLVNVGERWVRGTFPSDVTDLADLVDRLEKICPSVLSEDFRGERERYEASIRRSRGFVCRWS